MLSCDSPNALPPIPKSITVHIPGSDPITAPIYLPFYYGTISSFWIHFQVDPEVVRPYLTNTGLKPAVFDGMALVNLNFQNYTAHNGNSLAQTDELEFNIIAYPAKDGNSIPQFSAECFLMGEDQTKIYGNYRVHVPCDNRFAIAAGKALYGENKFYAGFNYQVPSPNLPTAKTWQYSIKDSNSLDIVSVNADIQNLTPNIANPAAIINYSMLDSRLIGSRRNLWAMVQNYLPIDYNTTPISIMIGDSPEHNMAKDLAAILGKDANGNILTRPYAIQVIQSPPVIAESRAYYAGY